jgi:hypothetical protein
MVFPQVECIMEITTISLYGKVEKHGKERWCNFVQHPQMAEVANLEGSNEEPDDMKDFVFLLDCIRTS